MLITNNVTGAASMFRRELLETALPFPPGGTGQELYHDHWLALCAMATAPLAYVDRPTHDYIRHDASVTVSEAEGHWVAPPSGRLGAVAMRARRAARRLRLASRSPGWRSAYVGRYLLIRQLGTILQLRLGDRILPEHRRDIDRLMAAEHSPRAAALAARPLVPPLDRPQRHALPRAGRLRRDPLAEAGGEAALGPQPTRRASYRTAGGGGPRAGPSPAGLVPASLRRSLFRLVGLRRSPSTPSSSQSAGSPRLADLTTLRPSIAHFIRVAEMSMPSRSRTVSFGRRRSSSRVMPTQLVGQQRGRGGRDRAALALEGDLGDLAVVVELDEDVLLVAAERIGVLVVEVVGVEAAEVVRPLVVLEDLIS